MGGRRPGQLPFLKLQPPPGHCSRHLEPCCASRASNSVCARNPFLLQPPRPTAHRAGEPRRRAPGPQLPALLPRSRLNTGTPQSLPRLRLGGPTESPRGAQRYWETGLAYGSAQITRVGGARAPHPRQHDSIAAPQRAAPELHTPSSNRSTPVGSRVSQELHYTKEKLGEEAAYTSQMLIQTARQEGENILTPEALGLHLQAALTASKVQVSLYGKSWDLNKICYKSGVPLIENGMIERMIEKLFPCVILTPLDCFWEGAKLQGGSAYLPGRPDIQWTNLDPEQLLEELGPFASLEGFRELLDKAQAPNVAHELSGGCHGFSHKFMHWQEELLLGGMARDPQGQLLRAEALQSTFLLMSPRQLYEHFRGDYQTHDIGWSEEQAGTVLQAWQRRFVQLAQEALPENASQQIHAFSSTTLDDILHAFSEVSAARVVGGYLLMLAYACVTMLRWDCAQSQGAVGLAGVLLVALAVASGLGLCALLGITFNAATTQVLPFLALGIGVDDVFLLAHAFTEALPGTPLQERMGECLQRTGTSVVLTSINNMAAFLMAALVPIPALRAFSLQAAIVVGCTFVAVMLVFPAILSLDLRRRHCQRLDVLCCFSSPCSARVIQILPQELEDETVPVGIAHLTATVQAFTHCEASSQHVVTILPPQAHLVPPPSDPLGSEVFSPGGSTRDLLGQEEETRQKAACKSLPCARWNLAHFARYQFAPLLLQSHAKAIVLVLFGALLGLSLYGATLVQDGLALTDVVPRGTKEHAFLSAQLRYFSLYEVALVTQGGFDYAHSQRALFDLHQRFSSLKAVLPPPATQAPRTWLHYYRSWLQGIQAAFDQDWASGRITRHSYRNGSEDGALAYKLLIQTGDAQEPLDFSQLTTRKLVDREGLIPPELFYMGLTVWVSSDPLGLAASQANFYPPPPEWLHDKYDTTGENLRIPPAQPLEFAQFPFLLRGLQKTADFVEAIEGARAACAEAGQAGVHAYPSGSPFLFWEQYLGLRRCFLLAVCILLVCTFLVCALLLLNPWTAGLIVLVLAMMTVELFGIMGFLGIKLSAIPVVILVASVGIGVEFTVHMALGFLTTQGSRNLRAARALEHTFAPVTDGAISTLLGLLMLAGSHFDFIVRYFFAALTVLTLLGLLHGLVLLPVLLSILGPPPEVIQMYKESPEVLSPPAPQGGGLRWGASPSLPQSFARVTTSMTVAIHPPPLPGAYVHPASDEHPWSPATTSVPGDQVQPLGEKSS
ncbi:protein patched homolog 2 isoform X2 [Macaca thibetana thibetana]|uniref:protein patched homolog 2 isoform X2 n=1 Tax=Macaca thibetana thibetana TaxID=257877 RepID=UPI0021BC5122|nr:protein patched homolog 2 isoform X2 [Macaca thibetana thibetana]